MDSTVNKLNIGAKEIQQVNPRGAKVHKGVCTYPSLVLVQPRKIRPFITERLLMGREESNQTNKRASAKSDEAVVSSCCIFSLSLLTEQ